MNFRVTKIYNPQMANRGRGLEELIAAQNDVYAARGIANIQKISTPWKVIRQGDRIVSAFPEGKSTLDFRGTVTGGIPVSFDAKESEDLCERCIFSFDLHCSVKMHGNCSGCVMDETGRPGGCKCLTVRRNTPCPYFLEVKDDGKQSETD